MIKTAEIRVLFVLISFRSEKIEMVLSFLDPLRCYSPYLYKALSSVCNDIYGVSFLSDKNYAYFIPFGLKIG